jgi:hypothetical protein
MSVEVFLNRHFCLILTDRALIVLKSERKFAQFVECTEILLTRSIRILRMGCEYNTFLSYNLENRLESLYKVTVNDRATNGKPANLLVFAGRYLHDFHSRNP